MRLICPNCDAQYEVDDAAIPDVGRDVQCSNCGNAWFQRHPEVEAEEQLSEEIFVPEDDESAFEPMMEVQTEVVPPPVIDPADLASIDPPPPLRRKAMDDSVLAVLREEAEREVAVRKTEAPLGVEVQADLGLQPPAPPLSPSLVAARARFSDLSADPAELAAEAEADARPPSRRELLPDIEEINSTLRASTEPRGGGDVVSLPLVAEDRRKGFRSGFVLMIVISVGLWMTYVMSPRIAAQIPASAGAMEAYVEIVDKARLGVDAALQSASRSLRDLSGSDS